MRKLHFLACGVLTGLILNSGCQTQVTQPMAFPKPATPTLVIRTGPIPAKPVPAVREPEVMVKPAATVSSAKPQAAVVQPEVDSDPNAWIESMRKLHANFNGTPGYVALLGDSITFADAFWTPLEYTDPAQYLPGTDGLPTHPQGKLWKDIIKGTRGKGLEHCNGSGWQVGYILRTIDGLIAREKPEVAILMIGTNDIGSGKVAPGWQEGYEKIVRKCLDANCIPILNTIPPRRDRDLAVADVNAIIRNVAAKYRVPLVDYHAEMVRRRPADEMYGTLMQKDGVHPSAGKTNVFTDTNLNDSGYALRNWLNFLAYREVYFRILHPEQAEAAKTAKR